MLMFCTPPATITSFVPLMTACAAKCTACWLDPHCRSMVVPGTSSGNPAASQAGAGDVAGLRADRVDAAEDDVLDGRRIHWLRSTTVVITCAPRSAGCTRLSPPPRLPTGVRTASTM